MSSSNALDLDDDWEEWDASGRHGSFLQHTMAGSAARVAEHLFMFPVDYYKVGRARALAINAATGRNNHLPA